MTPMVKSGFLLPNKFARHFLLALEDLAGKHGLVATLNIAHLSEWASDYPADDWSREVDHAEVSALHSALEDLFGPKGGRGLARQAASSSFHTIFEALEPFQVIAASIEEKPFEEMGLRGLNALSQALTSNAEIESTVREVDGGWQFDLVRCPVCWSRKSESPVCSSIGGLIEECLRWCTGGQVFQAVETFCISQGAQACVFLIQPAIEV